MTTVKDAYTRKLGQGAAAIIDTRIATWLQGEAFELRQMALSWASNQEDEVKIQAFFSSQGKDFVQFQAADAAPQSSAGGVVAGAGFGDPETNERVERAAIQAVTKLYKAEGWHVRSVEGDRRGFDLECRRVAEEEDVEVM